MATNYTKWDAFDVGKESEHVEKQWSVEDVEDNFKREETKIITFISEIQSKLRRIKDALISKAAAEALSARECGGRLPRKELQELESKEVFVIPDDTPIAMLAKSLAHVNNLLEAVVKENAKTVHYLNAGELQTAMKSGLALLNRLPSLEDHLNTAYTLLQHFVGDSGRTKLIDMTFDELEDARLSIPSIIANATATVSLCAVEMSRFALAVDMSRCHLKLFGDAADSERMAGTGYIPPLLFSTTVISTTLTSSTIIPTPITANGLPRPLTMPADGSAASDATRGGGGKSNTSQVAMWVTRGRAFACMGCPYIANVHFRQVERLMPTYPGIDSLCHFLDETEVKYALLRTSEKNMETLICNEIGFEFRCRQVLSEQLLPQKHKKKGVSSLDKFDGAYICDQFKKIFAFYDDHDECPLLSAKKRPTTASDTNQSSSSSSSTPCGEHGPAVSEAADGNQGSKQATTSCHSFRDSGNVCSISSGGSSKGISGAMATSTLHMDDYYVATAATDTVPTTEATVLSCQQDERYLETLVTAKFETYVKYPNVAAAYGGGGGTPVKASSGSGDCNGGVLWDIYVEVMLQTFYSAQMLYLENMHRSSELKHWASLTMALSIRDMWIRNTPSEADGEIVPVLASASSLSNILSVICRVCAAALLNIAASKVKQSSMSRRHTAATATSAVLCEDAEMPCELTVLSLPSVRVLLEMPTEELCDVAIRVSQNEPIAYIRKHLILSQVKSYSNGAEDLKAAAKAIVLSMPASAADTSPTPTTVPSLGSLFVLDHGDRSMFSQTCLCGLKGKDTDGILPFVEPREQLVLLDSMCAYISKEMEKYATTAGERGEV